MEVSIFDFCSGIAFGFCSGIAFGFFVFWIYNRRKTYKVDKAFNVLQEGFEKKECTIHTLKDFSERFQRSFTNYQRRLITRSSVGIISSISGICGGGLLMASAKATRVIPVISVASLVVEMASFAWKIWAVSDKNDEEKELVNDLLNALKEYEETSRKIMASLEILEKSDVNQAYVEKKTLELIFYIKSRFPLTFEKFKIGNEITGRKDSIEFVRNLFKIDVSTAFEESLRRNLVSLGIKASKAFEREYVIGGLVISVSGLRLIYEIHELVLANNKMQTTCPISQAIDEVIKTL